MKATHLTVILLIATTLAHSAGRFYAKINGVLNPITSLELAALDYLSLDRRNSEVRPEFILENGVPTTGEGKIKTVLAIVNDYLVFGSPNKVKPIELMLDGNSKVINLNPYLCWGIYGRLRDFIMSKDHSTKGLRCVPVDLYFMSSGEDERRVPDLDSMDVSDTSFRLDEPPETEAKSLDRRCLPIKSSSEDLASPAGDDSVSSSHLTIEKFEYIPFLNS